MAQISNLTYIIYVEPKFTSQPPVFWLESSLWDTLMPFIWIGYVALISSVCKLICLQMNKRYSYLHHSILWITILRHVWVTMILIWFQWWTSHSIYFFDRFRINNIPGQVMPCGPNQRVLTTASSTGDSLSCHIIATFNSTLSTVSILLTCPLNSCPPLMIVRRSSTIIAIVQQC